MTPIRIAALAIATVLALVTPGSGIRADPAVPARAFGSARGFTPPDGPSYGTYAWPVHGPVIRGFEPPPDPFGQGHRGIDIATPFGTDLVAAAGGMVAFAGWVGGSLFISIDHPDGVRTTYSWLSKVEVKKGDVVAKRQVIGQTGHGHPDVSTPHLHFGARIGSTYIDPMLLLERGSVVGLIHLAPVADGAAPRGLLPPYNERPWPSRRSTHRISTGAGVAFPPWHEGVPGGIGSPRAAGAGRSPLPWRRPWRVDPARGWPPPSRSPPGPRCRAVRATLGWHRRALRSLG